MFELLRQRIQSKTFRAAFAMAALSIIEIQSGFFSQFVPVPYRAYLVMLWPLVMLALREVTNTALADK